MKNQGIRLVALVGILGAVGCANQTVVAPPPLPQITMPSAPAVVRAPSAPAPAPAPVVEQKPVSLQITLDNPGPYTRGALYKARIVPDVASNIYCFLRDESKMYQRIFPNRMQKNSRVEAAGLDLPGSMRFELVANKDGITEQIACFASSKDILDNLPDGLRDHDFKRLDGWTLADIFQHALKASGEAGMTVAVKNVDVK